MNQPTQSGPRELPHDLLAEKSLLGCLIIDNSAFDEIADLKLVAEDFYHPAYGKIFDAIQDLVLANKPIDYVTLCSKLSERGQLESLGGQSFIIEIVEEQASAAHIYDYAKIVKEKSSLRDIVKTAQRVADLGKTFSGKTEDFIQEVEASFFKLTNEAKSGGMIKLNSTLRANLKKLEDTSRKPGEIAGIPTNYTDLDKILLGLQPGQLIVLAARPAMGKTALALNFGVNAVETTGLPIAIFSLEMMAEELSMRILTSTAKVPAAKVRMKDFNDTDLRNIGTAVQKLSNFPIYINDNGGTTVLDILSQCRKIKAEEGLGMIIIDYLQLMKSHTGNPSREQQIAEISRSLKSMAKELECPVIALSQLNRGVESRPNKRPNTSDLRESGAIEQDADIVMFIYRDEYYNQDTKEPGVAEVILGKNRAGSTGTVKLAFIGAYTSFEPLSQREDAPSNQ
ncbi:MAG: replicative DNA helicase [Bacteriovoracaceae bacterium]